METGSGRCLAMFSSVFSVCISAAVGMLEKYNLYLTKTSGSRLLIGLLRILKSFISKLMFSYSVFYLLRFTNCAWWFLMRNDVTMGYEPFFVEYRVHKPTASFIRPCEHRYRV